MSIKLHRLSLFFFVFSLSHFITFVDIQGKSNTPINSKTRLSKAKQARMQIPEVLNKDYRKLSDDELDEAIALHKKSNNLEMLVKCLERKIAHCNDFQKLREFKLWYADALFESKKIEKAGKTYNEYVMLYPGSNETEYAEYRAILCNFSNISRADRDQELTEQTVRLAEHFLKREKIYQRYSPAVKLMQQECYRKLFDHECYIFRFHLKNPNKKDFSPALNRLDYIKMNFREHIPSFEQELAKLERDLELAQKPLPRNPKKRQHEKQKRYGDKPLPEIAKPEPLMTIKPDYVSKF